MILQLLLNYHNPFVKVRKIPNRHNTICNSHIVTNPVMMVSLLFQCNQFENLINKNKLGNPPIHSNLQAIKVLDRIRPYTIIIKDQSKSLVITLSTQIKFHQLLKIKLLLPSIRQLLSGGKITIIQ